MELSVREDTEVVDERCPRLKAAGFCYGERLLGAVGGWLFRTVIGVSIIFAAALASQPIEMAAAPAQAAAAVSVASSDLARAANAIDDAQYDEALALVSGAAKAGKLSPADADWASYLRARALVGLKRGDEAEDVVRERNRANPGGYSWAAMVSIMTSRGRYAQAANAIVGLGETEFGLVNWLRPGVIESIAGALDRDQGELRDKLVMRLVEGHYTGPTSQRVPDTLRLRYINQLLRAQHVEDAVRQTESIETPAILSLLLTDRSFAALWEHPSLRNLSAPGALIARVERGVQAHLEQPVMSSSDWLDVMRALRVIGRADEAVRLGLHAVEQSRKEKRPPGSALRLEIARGYADLGQSWAARRTARELLREESAPSISLRVAVAEVLEASGDDDGALVLLGTLEGDARTPAVLKSIACAAHDLGRVEKREEAFAALDKFEERAAEERFDALVCTGRQVEAAKALADMFKRSDLRTAAILTAQLYADPVNPLGQHDMRYRMKALVASDAVQDAIKPYARTIALPFTIANARSN